MNGEEKAYCSKCQNYWRFHNICHAEENCEVYDTPQGEEVKYLHKPDEINAQNNCFMYKPKTWWSENWPIVPGLGSILLVASIPVIALRWNEIISWLKGVFGG